MKRSLFLIVILLLLVAPAAAQQNCPAPALLSPGVYAVSLQSLDVHDSAGTNTTVNGTLPQGEMFVVDPSAQPQCSDGATWWQISSMTSYGWIPETINGQSVVELYSFTPEAPVPFAVQPQQPVISNPTVPLPTVTPAADPTTLDLPFATWDWAAFSKNFYADAPDPLAMQLPSKYAGDLPVPPVDLSSVHFVKDANLNGDQLKLLAQNGFVVIPSSAQQFDDVYRDLNNEWDHTTGKAKFITTDALLHALFLSYQNTLMFLETNTFYGDVADFLMKGYQASETQLRQAAGTPLEASARKAAIYYAVPLMLIADGESSYVQGYNQTPVYVDTGVQSPSDVIRAADPTIIAAAQPLVDLALAAQGREQVPILDNYTEDFSQYKPRSYYAGNPLLESYFRAMMWLGRITFTAKSQPDTQTGLLVLRALQSDPTAYARWQHVADTIEFLVGPVDDYGPKDYAPLAQTSFGQGLPLTALSAASNLSAFEAQVAQLPPPRINSIPIPVGPITSEQLVDQTRGFRLFGQRFTFDGYIMQQLIYPAVGTADNSRALPTGLDVPEVLGSNMAYTLAGVGAAQYAHYVDNVASLRDQVNHMSANDWLQNLYGGWLWTLQPLAIRDANLTPPMMQTDAWKRKDLSTFLGSYTELKHATLLYAEQPMGGLGGGGMQPPVISYAYVEPNPQVFARITIVSALLEQGLEQRGYLNNGNDVGSLTGVQSALSALAQLSAQLAEMARKEIAGESLTNDELYFLQENFGDTLWSVRYAIEQWVSNPPTTTALVADIASNAAANSALELGIANPDLIYVITNSPYGLQLTRGAVYSDYEFTVTIDSRMTDDQWRQQVATGKTANRPSWIGLYFAG